MGVGLEQMRNEPNTCPDRELTATSVSPKHLEVAGEGGSAERGGSLGPLTVGLSPPPKANIAKWGDGGGCAPVPHLCKGMLRLK